MREDLGAAYGIELGNLDHPDAAHLLGGILAADLRGLVGEPLLPGKHLEGDDSRRSDAASDEGGRNWDCIASFIETAKLNGSEPFAYLTAALKAPAKGHPSPALMN